MPTENYNRARVNAAVMLPLLAEIYGERLSRRETAQVLGMTQQWVQQIESVAADKMFRALRREVAVDATRF